MLDAQDIKSWSRTIKESAEIVEALRSLAGTSQPINSPTPAPHLGLEQNIHPIDDILIQRGLTSSTAEECSARYVSQLQDVASKLQRYFSVAFASLHIGESFPSQNMEQQALKRLYIDSFDAFARQLREDSMEFVRQIRADFMAEVSGNGGKAWDPQARLLLEKAWERNQKLNAAEKKKLAAGCGLTIRQVSIWVSSA